MLHRRWSRGCRCLKLPGVMTSTRIWCSRGLAIHSFARRWSKNQNLRSFPLRWCRVRYLREVRPVCRERRLFLTLNAPIRPLTRAPTRRSNHAGIAVKCVGITVNCGKNLQWTVVDDAWTSGNLVRIVTGLTNDQSYNVQVRAVTQAGDGPWSATGTGTPDAAAPSLSAAAVSGAALTLSYDEALDETSVPAPGAFAVTVSGAARAVSGVAVSGRAVTLTLTSEVAAGQTVTVSYTAPAVNPIRGAAGNDAGNLRDRAVAVGPAVRSVGIVGPVSGDTFRYGETVEVQVQYNSRLEVTGAPRLALTVGSETRHATFSRSDSLLDTMDEVAVVAFTCRVQLADHDADGIAGTGPVDLNGGAMRG